MPSDAVWIIATIPKKEYEIAQREKNHRLKKPAVYSIYGPGKSHEEDPIEKQIEDALVELNISNITWISDKRGDHWHIYFAIDLYDNDVVLNRLRDVGIGVKRDTSLGYIPFGLFFTSNYDEEEEEGINKFLVSKTEGGFKRIQQEFLKSVTSRLTVAQVVEGVRSGASLTFDFLAYTVFAGFVAAAGLLNNSSVDIAAAMMIEPIMSTVMAVCFGAIIHDRSLAKLGAINLCVVLLICVLIGFFYGLVFFVWSAEWDPPPDGIWPTEEMEVRGVWRTLIYGLLQAMAAGGAVAITLLNDAQCPLVGVAVASTFLPPHINTGLLWAYACHLEWRGLNQDYVVYNASGTFETFKPAWIPQSGYKVHYYNDMRYESLALGGVSLLLTYVNVVGMIFVAYIMLWIKQVVPLGKMDSNKRFFKEDIRVARYYNRRGVAVNTDDLMGQQLLREWAETAGLDPAQLLSQKPEARITQFQTLKDLITDVENDEVYQSVTKGAMGRPEAGNNLLRRLTQTNIYGSAKSAASQGVTNLGFIGDSKVSESRDRRRYTITSRKDSKRTPSITIQASEDTVTAVNDRTISSENSITRGMRLDELEPRGRRKSSVLLRKHLQESDHSPFSVWPTSSNATKSTGRFQVSEVRQRMSSLVRPSSPTIGERSVNTASIEDRK